MAPLLIASLLGGAVLGGMKAKRQQQDAEAMNKYRKAAITYSPWTGMSDPGGSSAPGMLEGALGGALTGAQVGGALTGMGVGAEEAAGAAGASGDMATTNGANYAGLGKETLKGVGQMAPSTLNAVNSAMAQPQQPWTMMAQNQGMQDPNQLFQLDNSYLTAARR